MALDRVETVGVVVHVDQVACGIVASGGVSLA